VRPDLPRHCNRRGDAAFAPSAGGAKVGQAFRLALLSNV